MGNLNVWGAEYKFTQHCVSKTVLDINRVLITIQNP